MKNPFYRLKLYFSSWNLMIFHTQKKKKHWSPLRSPHVLGPPCTTSLWPSLEENHNPKTSWSINFTFSANVLMLHWLLHLNCLVEQLGFRVYSFLIPHPQMWNIRECALQSEGLFKCHHMGQSLFPFNFTNHSGDAVCCKYIYQSQLSYMLC